jgi:hypothetical protein
MYLKCTITGILIKLKKKNADFKLHMLVLLRLLHAHFDYSKFQNARNVNDHSITLNFKIQRRQRKK